MANFATLLQDTRVCLGFFSRLAGATPALDWRRQIWAAPLAGAALGAISAVALLIAHALGLPSLVCAALALGALIAASGGLHEDGLADVADGFGGGTDKAAKLAIMRDSRIGAFGAMALGLSLILRIGALSALLDHGAGFAAAGLLGAAVASRAVVLAPFVWLAPARSHGLGVGLARLPAQTLWRASAAALAICLLLGLAQLGVWRALAALALAFAAGAGLCALARRQIGGQTGDVGGAAQQLSEIAFLCGLLIGLGPP